MTTTTRQVHRLSSTVTAEVEDPDRLVLWRESLDGRAAPVRIGLTKRAEARLLEVLLARAGRG